MDLITLEERRRSFRKSNRGFTILMFAFALAFFFFGFVFLHVLTLLKEIEQ